MKNINLNVGLVGLGLNTYWPQFPGLYERLCGYQEHISEKLCRDGINVINAGIADCPEKSVATAESLKESNIDILLVYVSTYALSSTVLPLVQRLDVPVLLLNLQPEVCIDYDYINSMNDRGQMTGEWLANCQACSIPEFANVFNRSGIRYDIVTGYLDDPYSWKEINEWLDAAIAKKGMRNNRMGVLGHYYCGMLDVYSDLTLQSSTFGNHIEILEFCELKNFRDNVTDKEVHEKIQEFRDKFEVVPECDEYELERAARTSVALDKLASAHNLGSIAYYYEGYNGNDYENIVTSVIAGNTLLTGKNIPVAGECEIKNVQAMKIMSLLDAGGSFSEIYAMDFKDDVVLLGHDGPAHFNMSDEKVKLVPLPVYHGKPGKGLSIQMSVKHGKVTVLSVCEGKNGLFLLVAEGESVPGPVLNIGNTNSRYRFPCGVRSFIDNWSKAGPSHHCAIGIGHIAGKIRKLASLLDIECVEIK
ncbi:MAG: L-fucose/L-arabinose isomerase family protein [Parabacteroides sp.]|nr:L-fucose/L-arabinose isomerase family protein [Parabacteroides sp.]